MSEVKFLKGGVERIADDPMVIKNVKDWFHIHTYGGLTPFFKGLAEGKLMGTRCTNGDCEENRIWLPPRVHCPDCLEEMEWIAAPTEGKIYTHSTVLYPGELFRLSIPCSLISIELEGVCTKFMSYLKKGEPKVGMPVKAEFKTEDPTNTILDICWVPA